MGYPLGMQRAFCFLLLGLALPASAGGLSAEAQTSACAANALPEAAKAVAALRHQLHEQAVPEDDPHVPAAVATQLSALKDALTQPADAVLACASPEASASDLQKTLADALHANLSAAAETTLALRDGEDLGAYGSDLAVEVLPLFRSPRYLDVNFRYGIECGDDNLLLVFEVGSPDGPSATTATAWHPVRRWDAPKYNTVGDAFGDFVLLTPLSGFPGQRNWRFVVAHGHPACGHPASPSRFDLDLLEPTADPAHPDAVWHLEHPYLRPEEPRLSTTEDTLTFELRPAAKPPGKNTAQAETYRFRVGKDNHVEPVAAALGTSAAASSPTSLNTNSPR